MVSVPTLSPNWGKGLIMNNTITLTDNYPSILHLCKRGKRLEKIIGMIGNISHINHMMIHLNSLYMRL